MPNQCIHCSEVYSDGAKQTLEGCSKCGSRFFFYLTEEKLQKIRGQKEESPLLNLTEEDKKNIEEDVREITGIQEIDAPVILDLETVKVTSPGKYLLDIPNLFSKERPLVYKLEDGKYVIDLSSTIKKK
jgi:predicted  nucleic acid-binding Zn-ribbon protein